MKIGDKFYSFDENRRRYRRLPGGKPVGTPIYREHFYEVEIVGESSRSWIIGVGGDWKREQFKVPKSDPFRDKYGEFGARPMIWTAAMMEDECWVHEHRHKIIEEVRTCDYVALLEVAYAVGYPDLR